MLPGVNSTRAMPEGTSPGLIAVETTPPPGEEKSADTSLCRLEDYADWNGAWYYYRLHGDEDYLLSLKFFPMLNHVVTVNEARIIIREASDVLNGDGSGGCDLIVQVWDDVGGLPGHLLYTEVVDKSQIPMDEGFTQTVTLNGSAGVYCGYDSYHISVGVEGDDADYITFLLNQNADGTDNGQSYLYDSGWMDMETAFGVPLNVPIQAFVCYEFSFCYVNDNIYSDGFIFNLPGYGEYHTQGSDINGFGQRIDILWPETLKTVSIWLYDEGEYAGTNELNGLDIMVVPDKGSGSPDYGTILAQASVNPGYDNIYPAGAGWNKHVFDFSSLNLVMFDNFHVLCKTSGDDPADGRIGFIVNDVISWPEYYGGSINFADPAAGEWELFSQNDPWMSEIWGVDAAVKYESYDCLEDVSNYYCDEEKLYYDRTDLTGLDGSKFVAQKVFSNAAKNIEYVSLLLTTNAYWGLTDDDPSQIDLCIWADAGNQPGELRYQIPVVTSPGWTDMIYHMSLSDIFIFGDYWIGYTWVQNSPSENLVMPIDYNTTDINGGAYFSADGVNWDGPLSSRPDLGWASGNLILSLRYCNVTSYADDINWQSLQHYMFRGGVNYFGLKPNAHCDLTLNKRYQDPDATAFSLGPIIFEGKVVAPFNGGEYKVFDLSDISTPLYYLDGFGENHSVPSVFEVDNTPYLFLAAGDQTGVYCYDFSTVPATPVWAINEANGYLGHPVSETYGTNYTNFIVLDDGVDDILFFTTDNGMVFAAYAATGLPYSGWDATGNFIKLGGLSGTTTRGFASNNSNTLYISYFGYPKGGIASIDAFSGSFNWILTGSELKGSEVYGTPVNIEYFEAGLVYFGGNLYTVSTCEGDYPVDGVLYSVRASDGNINYAKAANGMRYAQTPVVEEHMLFCPTYSRWAQPVITNGALTAYNTVTGTILWICGWGNEVADNRFYTEIALSYDPFYDIRYLFAFSDRGFFHCVDGYNGTELFNRRVDYGAAYGLNIGGGIAIGVDPDDGLSHILCQSASGGLFDLTRQEGRPRLDIPTYNITEIISTGDNTQYPLMLDNFYRNTGCAPLEVSIDIDTVSNGFTPNASKTGSISGGLLQSALQLVDKMTLAQLQKYGLAVIVEQFDETADIEMILEKQATNPAALAAPAFIAVDHYDMPSIGEGESRTFVLYVDQTQLVRGIQTCYAVLTSNDPDFFINDPTFYGLPDKPEVKINILSGCAPEKADLYFGESQQWVKSVSNCGRLGDQNWEPGLFDIEGIDNAIFQGSYIYGTSKYRLAMNSQDWNAYSHPLDGEDAVFRSMQAVPNFVSEDCTPALELGENLGFISYNAGSAYYTLYGNVAYSTIIDSVQNWDDSEGWDWSNVTQFYGPFDDTLTMGLTADVTTIGVYGEEALNGNLHNCVIKVFEFEERNGRAINDWYMGSYQDMDYEATSGQEVGYDESISAAWTYSTGNTVATGTVKIPFGCDYEPLINAIHFYGNTTEQTGFWGYAYWDSAYSYMSNYSGAVDLPAGETDGDGESHYTFVRHDYEPYGEYTFAVAYFQLTDITPGAEATPEMKKLARRANQFMGWGRGDVNDDGVINLLDIVYLANYIYAGGPGPTPFRYLGNMEPVTDGAGINLEDIMFLIDLYFENGPCPEGVWKHINPAWDAGDL
ncbi:MAG: hypothetical protein ACOYVF_08670 [Candidatus Zixiibacteriota bacterium]